MHKESFTSTDRYGVTSIVVILCPAGRKNLKILHPSPFEARKFRLPHVKSVLKPQTCFIQRSSHLELRLPGVARFRQQWRRAGLTQGEHFQGLPGLCCGSRATRDQRPMFVGKPILSPSLRQVQAPLQVREAWVGVQVIEPLIRWKVSR